MEQELSEERAEEALALARRASGEEDPAKAVQLADCALELDPGCVEAWLARAEAEDDSVETALNAYRRAAEAARAQLGESFFAELEGQFWEVLESRPYMRARLGEALCLYELHLPGEAAAALKDMLRLNPADDQGVRYILLTMLIELDRIDEAAALLEEYGGDVSPVWLYGRVLVDWLRLGPVQAEPARARALKAWPDVVEFLAVPLPEPDEDGDPVFPELNEDADEEELCALEMRASWELHPKALAWLLEGN